MTEIKPPLMQLFLNRVMLPENERDPDAAKAGEEAIQRPLKVLDAHLADRNHILGQAFSIADLNVASVLAMAALVSLDLSAHPNVQRWLGACVGRPSFAKAQSQ